MVGLVFGVKAIPSEFTRLESPLTFIGYLDDLFSRISRTQASTAANLERGKQKSKLLYIMIKM